MNYLKWIANGLLVLALLGLAQYINENRSYGLEEMTAFLASCGTLVQTGFGSYKPGIWDYFLVLISAVIVLYTLWFSVKYMVQPSEHIDHIKFQILEDEKER